jgi:hypothetical protein
VLLLPPLDRAFSYAAPSLGGRSSIVVGVDSKDEDAFPAVGGANIGRSISSPFRKPPDFGKVSEDIGKAQSEVA